MNKKGFYSKFLLTLLVVLFVFSSFFVCAQNYGDFSIKLPSGYKSALKNENKKEIADIVGVAEKELDSYFEDGKLEFLAVNSDNTSQIKLSVSADDFSEKIISFNNLDDEKLLGLANSFFTGPYESVSKNTVVVNSNGCKYLKHKEKLTDSGGEYTVTQFITVYDGKTYRLSVSYTDNDSKNFDNQILKNFEIKEKDNISPLLKVALTVAVLIFAAVIISTSISIFNTYKTEKDQEKLSEE